MVKRVLVVDDSPIARRIMLSCLPKDRGYEVFQAVDGEDGFNKFKDLKPDITFLDITMPVRDGLQTLECIRAHDAEAVVIMCTADIQPQSISRASSLGAITVLRKPPTKEGVADAISQAERAIDLRGNRDL
jgi:two-component system, chemotaxis family, chemotaxis protein CheY